jgi:hypothetical protein
VLWWRKTGLRASRGWSEWAFGAAQAHSRKDAWTNLSAFPLVPAVQQLVRFLNVFRQPFDSKQPTRCPTLGTTEILASPFQSV